MSSISNWIVPIPFYFLELLIGFVQAFVFTLLVSVYIGLICNHGDDHGHDGLPQTNANPIHVMESERKLRSTKVFS